MKIRNQHPSNENDANSNDVQTSQVSSEPQERRTGAYSISSQQTNENRRNSHSTTHEDRSDSSSHIQPQLSRSDSNSITLSQQNESPGDYSDPFSSPPLPEIQSDLRPVSDSQENLPSNSVRQNNPICETSYTSTEGHSTNVRTIQVEILAPNSRDLAEFDVSRAGPKFVEYEAVSARLETFSQWSDDYYVKPSDLANAGLFYHGPGDKVRCYFCGGFLRDWEQDDDPLKEHERWFKNCGFLRQLREGARANQ